MKIVWEPEDIRVGRRVCTPGCSETWMIGFEIIDKFANRFCVVSLADGMISRSRMSAEEVADYLTKAGNHPVELLTKEKD